LVPAEVFAEGVPFADPFLYTVASVAEVVPNAGVVEAREPNEISAPTAVIVSENLPVPVELAIPDVSLLDTAVRVADLLLRTNVGPTFRTYIVSPIAEPDSVIPSPCEFSATTSAVSISAAICETVL
jgi:hypothetical protein